MQVIATTYSPLTAQQAGRDELYALHRSEDGAVELVPFVGEPSWMLLHQLLMSPMFGLETDESVQVEGEKAAARGRALSGRKAGRGKAGKTGDAALQAMPEAVGAPRAQSLERRDVNTRSNSSTDPEDLALLRQINEALQASSSENKPSDKA
jgi:hypothetical protein